MVNWKDIHEGFGKKDYSTSPPCETYQQYWEGYKLTYQDAQEWIPAGFKPDDYDWIKKWKRYNFTSQEAKSWLDVGLKPRDYEFISQLKQNNLTAEQYIYYKENKTIQEQLDYFFNKTQVETIYLEYLKSNQSSELIITDYPNLKKIKGWNIPNLTHLTITNCPQLEEIYIRQSNNLQQLILNNLPKLKELICSCSKQTTLEINNCANLKTIHCSDNQLTQIKLPQGERLETLYLSHNNLNQDLSFLSGLVNLNTLELNNNPLHGSLEYLKGMSKLKHLDISNTDIDRGLEYLLVSLRYFKCSDTPLINSYSLEPYSNGYYGTYNLKKWREDNQFLIAKTQLLADKEQQIARLEAEILTKQEELETSLTNQQQLKQEKTKLEEKLTTLQAKYEELLEQATNRQKLLKTLGEKKKELETLRKNCDYKPHQKLLVKILLKTEEDINLYNAHGDHETKEEIIKDLKEGGFEEVDNLCQLQTEIIQIDKQLDKIREQARTIIEDLMELTKGQFFLRGRQQNLILFGDINVNQGNAFIGNEFGANANLSHNNYTTGIEEMSEELEALQIQPAYGIPGSSK